MVKGKIPKSTEVFRECDEKSPTMKNNKGRGPRKKIVKSLVFCQTGGSRRVVKSQTSILEKYFFSEHVESDLGPQKHVFHLVPSPNAIAKAVM